MLIRKEPKVILISPHKNEHPTALSFQAKLAGRLWAKGFSVVVDRIDTLVSQSASQRARLVEKCGDPLPSHISDGFAQVLRMQDFARRFEKIDSLAQNCPKGTLVVEIHASSIRALGRRPKPRRIDYDDDFQQPEQAPSLFWGIRAGNIKIGALKPMADLINQLVIDYDQYFAERAAEKLGINLKKMREKLKARIQGEWPNPVYVVEVPGATAHLPLQSEHYKIYFSEDGKPRKDLNKFEKTYCITVRNQAHFYRQFFFDTVISSLPL